MRYRSLIVAVVLAVPLLAQTPGPVVGTETYTFTSLFVTAVTNKVVDVETYQTQITARLNGGAPAYDQSFAVAFADPSVQAAVTQARAALTPAGGPSGVSITGPTQLSSNRVLTNSSAQTVDGPVQQSAGITTVTVGPATIMVGDNAATPFVVRAGDTNYDLRTTYTTPRTVTTTNTYKTTQVYLLAGTATAPPPAVPLPPSVVLGLTGMAGAGLYELRRRWGRSACDPS